MLVRNKRVKERACALSKCNAGFTSRDIKKIELVNSLVLARGLDRFIQMS